MPGDDESIASWMYIPGEDTRTGNQVERHVKMEFITSNAPCILMGKNLQKAVKNPAAISEYIDMPKLHLRVKKTGVLRPLQVAVIGSVESVGATPLR